MRHCFILNPASGPRDAARRLEERIRALHLDTEIFRTQKAGDARAFAARAVSERTPVRLYACGGDGTLNEVVNAAAGHPHAAVTNVPTGTGNDFLRLFGPQGKVRFLDLEALAAGPQRPLDLMDCNGFLGVNIVCAGVDARVAVDVHRYKRLPLIGKHGAYLLSLAEHVLFRGLSRPLEVEMGGLRWSGEATLLCVCNGRYYGGGFMPVGHALPDDGVLDMLLVPGIGLLSFARLVGKYAKGRYRELRHILMDYHGQSVKVRSREPIPLVVDGETLWGTEFSIRLSERRVNFFYPEGVDFTPHMDGEQN